jgi:16S rRNA (guanine966-N2)-methyltransferase
MRIIGGEFRSRRLLTPRDALTTRPIPDRVKESLFGLLRGHTEGAQVFDAFAGTGAIGLEAISRGASRCIFVERDREIAGILQRNIDALGVQDLCEVVVGDALGAGALARCPRPVTLVFMDPPYALVSDPAGWQRLRMQLERLIGLLADDGFAILRTPWPFVLRPGDQTEHVEGHPGRRGRGERKGRRRTGDGGELDRRVEVEPSQAKLESIAEAGDLEAPAPRPQPIRGDLTLGNAEGPETHLYHTMAVHLYARRH